MEQRVAIFRNHNKTKRIHSFGSVLVRIFFSVVLGNILDNNDAQNVLVFFHKVTSLISSEHPLPSQSRGPFRHHHSDQRYLQRT